MSEKLFFVDLSGTLTDHETHRPIALMPELLSSAKRHGWTVTAVSRHPTDSIRATLRELQLDEDVEALSSSGAPKGKVIDQALAQRGPRAAVFVDDKPDNLESAKRLGSTALRIVGFVGSRKYVPKLSHWCQENGIELALSALDLAETLAIPLPLDTNTVRWFGKYTPGEIADLLMGSDHPASAVAGETAVADHRAVPYLLLEGGQEIDFHRFWRNLAWVSCRECSWKLLVRSVLHSAGFEPGAVLGNAYKDHEYISAIASFVLEHPETELMERISEATDTMEDGIEAIGNRASNCRPQGRGFDDNRMEDIQRYVRQVEAELRRLGS